MNWSLLISSWRVTLVDSSQIVELSKYLVGKSVLFTLNAEIKRIHWLKMGKGKAGIAIFPDSKAQFVDVIKHLRGAKMEFLAIGNGSNCYFTNNANIPVLIVTTKIREFRFETGYLYADAGVPLASLAKECSLKGIDGYAGMVGIPGTVGAAARNNSGSYYDCEMSKLVISVDIIDENGNLKTITNEEMGYAHRSTKIKRGELDATIVGVKLNINVLQDPKIIRDAVENSIKLRQIEQEVRSKTLGSIFVGKNLLEAIVSRNYLRIKLLNISIRISGILAKLAQTKNKLSATKLFFWIFMRPDLVENVSSKSINCYTWNGRDLNDREFFSYLDFMKHVSGKEIEVEVFSNSVHPINVTRFCEQLDD